MAFQGWSILAIIWFIRILSRMVIIRTYGPLTQACPYRSYSWIVAPSIAIVTLFLCREDLPLICAFTMSRAAMDQLAKQAALLPTGSTLPDRRVGFFYAERIEALPGGVRFVIREACFFDEHGFAWSSSPLPKRQGRDSYKPFRAGWYLYERRF